MKLETITCGPKTNKNAGHILFIHGTWHGAWCWEENFLPYFSENGYHVHALSLRGHGKSEGKEKIRWTGIEDFVEDVAQAVNELPEPPVLIGHSMGGYIVLKYLETRNVPAAVLLSPIPVYGAVRILLKVLRRHPLLFLQANAKLSLYPIIKKPAYVRESFFSKDIDEKKLNLYFSLLTDDSYRAFLDMLILNLPKPGKVRTDNLLFIGAENDMMVYPGEVMKTAAAYKTKAGIIPGIAHDMMLESGWRLPADMILKWLNEKGL